MRLQFTAPLAFIIALLPVCASAQTFWNVDVAATGTFTPLGGSDRVGFGPAVSAAVTKDRFAGEKDSNGAGIVGMFMTTWTPRHTIAARHHENWFLVGARGNVWEDVGLLAVQAVGGVKHVTNGSASGETAGSFGAFGLGISFNMPPVGHGILIRALDLNWFLTPGDSASTHRFSIGFGIDALLGHSPYSGE